MRNEQAERYFAGFEGARAILDSVLDGEQGGRIIEGRSGAVAAHREGWMFLGGDPDEDIIAEIERMILDAERERIYCVPMSESWDKHLVRCELAAARRTYLKRLNLQPPSVSLPPGFVIAELNAANLTSALKLYNVRRAAQAWGGPDDLLNRSFGYVVFEEGGSDAASAAVAYAIARNRMEISIATEPKFKGRGLAKCASSALIGECDRRELQADWNCFSDSLVSVAIALKLGFEPKIEYQAWVRRNGQEPL